MDDGMFVCMRGETFNSLAEHLYSNTGADWNTGALLDNNVIIYYYVFTGPNSA